MTREREFVHGETYCEHCEDFVVLCSHGMGIDYKELCERAEKDRDEWKAQAEGLAANLKVFRESFAAVAKTFDELRGEKHTRWELDKTLCEALKAYQDFKAKGEEA